MKKETTVFVYIFESRHRPNNRKLKKMCKPSNETDKMFVLKRKGDMFPDFTSRQGKELEGRVMSDRLVLWMFLSEDNDNRAKMLFHEHLNRVAGGLENQLKEVRDNVGFVFLNEFEEEGNE